MKICPHCAFANPERFPACLLCNTLLVDVPSQPSSDPNDPEHAQRAAGHARRRTARKETAILFVLYAVFVTGTAAFPGLVLNPLALGLYFLSSALLVGAVLLCLVGQLTAPLLQGGLSVLLVFYFGPAQPLIFFMLAGHILGPGVLWHAIDHVQNGHR
jgi:hypothetical protein